MTRDWAALPVWPDPRKKDLRLAVVMTGGSSLAIWMGGVATEIDRMLRSCRAEGPPPELEVYAQLLRLAGYRPRVDVVSGTSAGGINGSVLAAAVARRTSLEGLRELWLDAASFTKLLRSAFARDPQSLLQGDEYFTPNLQDAFRNVLGDDVNGEPGEDHPIDLLVTTTLMNGQDSRLVDDFGTLVHDVDHKAEFRFQREDLMGDQHALARRLALAARSSASFPIAFEPSWVPVTGTGDDLHPSMKDIADFRRDSFVIDGGVLVNRPLGPALEAIFAKPADSQDVRRVMFYVIPDPGESVKSVEERQQSPPDLGDAALRSLMTIPRVQSIARDLEDILEHNRRVRDQRSARRYILERWPRLYPDVQEELTALLPDYRDRRATRVADELIAKLTRRWPESLDFEPHLRQVAFQELKAEYLETLPDAGDPPHRPAQDPLPAAGLPIEDLEAWGLESIERAGVVALDLIQSGLRAAAHDTNAHRTLALARQEVHEALGGLRTLRESRDSRLADPTRSETFAQWATRMLEALYSDDGHCLKKQADAVNGALEKFRRGVGQLNGSQADRGLREIAQNLAPRSETPLRRVLALEVLQEALGIRSPVVEQAVELLQVSANTRDAFTDHKEAADKLTGIHLAHFAAFYKPSWRANDWMWGRLDAAGWLVQLLLAPDRLRQIAEAGEAEKPSDAVRGWITAIAVAGPHKKWLAAKLDKTVLEKELAWLDNGDDPPAALPECSLAVSRRLQLEILTEELKELAAAVDEDEDQCALSQSGRDFRRAWGEGTDSSPEALAKALRACDFAKHAFAGEGGSDLLAQQASSAAATAVSALAGERSGLPDAVRRFLGPGLAAARGVALVVHGTLTAAISRSRTAVVAIIGAMAIAGALLAVAVLAEGSQPVLVSTGFTVLLSGWIVGFWRSRHRWFYVPATLLVVIVCILVALIPWILTGACPTSAAGKPTSCERFLQPLEPVFVVLALVGGAAASGSRALAPKARAPRARARSRRRRRRGSGPS